MSKEESLAARLAALSSQQRAELARRLADRRDAPAPTIPRRAPGEPVPMSFAQWRLWFLEQLRPGTNAWNTAVAARLRGALDVDALRRSLALLVHRHATLRTVFVAPGGKPAPVPLDDPPDPLHITPDPLRATEQPTSLHAFVAREAARPFDLEHDALLRASLLRLGDDDHVLVLVAHHIACDGWSKGLLLDDLASAYDALRQGREPQLPELPIEYADFAVWQRHVLGEPRLEELKQWWRAQLAGAPSALPLPTDHPRPRVQAYRGAVQWLRVPSRLADGVLSVGREERATPFMTLLAAFVALLHLRTGERDIAVGAPAAMRTHAELERIVGLFANTLVYRARIPAGASFRDCLRSVRETALGVYAHQELPFEQIVEAVRPPRDASRNPLVQVNFRLEGREPAVRLAGLEVESIEYDPGIARFDLAIELGASGDGYAGYLEYDTALFEPATAATLAHEFLQLLEQCGKLPNRPLGAVGQQYR